MTQSVLSFPLISSWTLSTLCPDTVSRSYSWRDVMGSGIQSFRFPIEHYFNTSRYSALSFLRSRKGYIYEVEKLVTQQALCSACHSSCSSAAPGQIQPSALPSWAPYLKKEGPAHP